MEDAIFSKGRLGQLVVLDNVQLEATSELYGYSQPAFFIIKVIKWTSETDRDEDHLVYVLEDNNENKKITVSARMGWWLVDINRWASGRNKKFENELKKKNKVIKTLNDQITILKEVITETQRVNRR